MSVPLPAGEHRAGVPVGDHDDLAGGQVHDVVGGGQVEPGRVLQLELDTAVDTALVVVLHRVRVVVGPTGRDHVVRGDLGTRDGGVLGAHLLGIAGVHQEPGGLVGLGGRRRRLQPVGGRDVGDLAGVQLDGHTDDLVVAVVVEGDLDGARLDRRVHRGQVDREQLRAALAGDV